jgi:hypothetical protein
LNSAPVFYFLHAVPIFMILLIDKRCLMGEWVNPR